MDWSDCYEVADGSVVLRVHVQPGAGRAAVVGRHGDALRVRVAAPPADGRANDAVAALLAEVAGVDRGAVKLVSGEGSRVKRFRLVGVDAERLEQGIEVAAERRDDRGRRRR